MKFDDMFFKEHRNKTLSAVVIKKDKQGDHSHSAAHTMLTTIALVAAKQQQESAEELVELATGTVREKPTICRKIFGLRSLGV